MKNSKCDYRLASAVSSYEIFDAWHERRCFGGIRLHRDKMKGNIYFEIPVDLEEGWMSYTPEPGHDKTAEWLIVFPKD